MEWFNNNLWQILVFLGLGLLALEVIVLGLSTFVLFFVGLGTLITGVLMYIGLFPPTLIFALGSVAIISGALALLLWQPMKQMQEKVDHKPVTSDVIGHRFVLETDISDSLPGFHSYSGVMWKVVAAEPLNAGTEVKVSRTEVGELTVQRA